MRSLYNITYEENLRKWNVFSLEKTIIIITTTNNSILIIVHYIIII